MQVNNAPATIVCAYIMKYLNLSYKSSTELMKSKRVVVFTPLPNFDDALRLFEDKLKKLINNPYIHLY